MSTLLALALVLLPHSGARLKCFTQLPPQPVASPQRPWLVFLKRIDSSRASMSGCGGSILNEEFILTAAHCVTASNLSKSLSQSFQVMAGVHDRRLSFLRSPIGVSKIFVHPLYNLSNPLSPHDVALLQLDTRLQFSSDSVYPICLPSKPKMFDSSASFTITGYVKFLHSLFAGNEADLILVGNFE